MELTKVVNHYAKDFNPWTAFAQGKWALLLVGAALCVPFITQWANDRGYDLTGTILCNAVPFAAVYLFVVLFINDKPPSYPKDIWRHLVFGLGSFLYRHSCIDRPPQLWTTKPGLVHPHAQRS